MTEKNFIDRIERLGGLYKDACDYDKKLENAFGGDSVIITDWWSSYLDNEVKQIAEELGDTDEFIDWLFWESMNNSLFEDEYNSFFEDGIEYVGNPTNVWKSVTGNLSNSKRQKLTEKIKNDIIFSIDNDFSFHEIMWSYMQEGIVVEYKVKNEKPLVLEIDFGLYSEVIELER